MDRTTGSPWRTAVYGIGALLIVIPALFIGVSAADAGGDWPPLTDVRYVLILAGVVVLVGARIGDRRGSDR